MSADPEKTIVTPLEPDAPAVEVPRPVPTKTLYDPIGRVSSAHAEAFWAPKVKSAVPYEELIPEVPSDSLYVDRRRRVAAHVARGVLTQSNFRNPNDNDRPQTPGENIMAFRMGDKKLKADVWSLERNKIAEPYLEPVTVPDPDRPGHTKVVRRPNFRVNDPSRSARERRVARKDMRRYEKLNRKIGRLMTGRAVPLTGVKVGGFEQVAATGTKRRSS